jgi:2-methylcitrate dehydratase PrpD
VPESLTLRLAAAAAGPFTSDDLLLDRARLLLYDYLVVARRGALADSSLAARAALADEIGSGPARLEGTDQSASARTAALLNALAAHAIELDDTHEPGSLHPGVAVWPAVLAVAQQTAARPAEVLHAAIAGYGVMCHVARVLGGAAAYARGFHPTGVCGVFGAAVGAGVLLGLDEQQMQHALGIAATGAAGSMEYLTDGAHTKRLNPGLAAANGILAARLASAGFRGPVQALEGQFGFLHSYGDTGSRHRLELPFDITAGVHETSIKLYPCCRYMHGCMDLLIDLAVEHDLAPADVLGIGCGVLSAGQRLIAEPLDSKRAAHSQVDAQFSMPFGAALALTRRGATLEDFEQASDVANELRPLMSRVECFTAPALDALYPESWPAEVWVRTSGGEVLRHFAPGTRGSPAFPATWADVEAKASRLIGEDAATTLATECRNFGKVVGRQLTGAGTSA